MPNTIDPPDNWTHFRHLLEQLLENVAVQAEIIKSLLEEGSMADHLDFVREINDTHRNVLPLDFGTTSNTVEQPPLAKERTRSVAPIEKYPNRQRPWEEDDLKLLESALAWNLPYEQIAERLGRTTHAVQQQVSLIRKGYVKSDRPAVVQQMWTFQEENELRAAVRAGLTVAEIAELLSRTVNSVKKKRSRMQAEGML